MTAELCHLGLVDVGCLLDTGWLQTSWPIDGGETFAITFHLHDTADGIYDSEVILDQFQFMGTVVQGTHPD